MKHLNKIVFVVGVLLIAFSTLATYYKFVILEDFYYYAEIDCDPETETCFTWICDPEVDGEEYCTGDLAEDTWYYKSIERYAYDTLECDPYGENCLTTECADNEEACYITNCTPELVEEYELDYECTDPNTFEWPDYFD
ncbi:hypothetical protein KC851_04660 [Candidatus Kaiserbacteria bacterium]|nr:hypothetical protein [Candidatus Kaiserbacteria bacterium]